MLQHVFATMNELLDKVIEQYPHAEGEQKQQLEHQLSLLCSMSDHVMEEWLHFEERLSLMKSRNNKKHVAQSYPSCTINTTKPPIPDYEDPYQRGQGYYLLMMYEDAAKHLERATQRQPENIGMRAYLAMSYLHLGHWQKAGHHFQLMISLTNNNSIQAIACNALGCIYAKQNQLAEAQTYFQRARKLDPTLSEPVLNLQVCQSKSGHLEFGDEHMMRIQ